MGRSVFPDDASSDRIHFDRPRGSRIQSIISVAGYQVIRNLSELSEFTLMHLVLYADYLRQVEPRTESSAVRALLTTGGPQTKKLHWRDVEDYGPYQMMLNVDGISIYTRTYVTTDSDQMGQIYLGHEESKVRRIGHDVMQCWSKMQYNRVRGRCDCTSARQQWEENWSNRTAGYRSKGKRDANKDLGFTREALIPTNLRFAAADHGAIYVAGRTPKTVLHMGGRDLWMSFLVVENSDDSDQFI